MASVLRLDETSIANEALALAEQPPIASLSADRGKAAETCRTFFASVMKTLQAGYKWNDMSRWLTLPEAADAPASPEHRNAYRLPSDVLRVVQAPAAGRDYRKMGRYLYCNVPLQISAEVIQLVTDPTDWDERLRAVFVVMLAHKIAPRLGTSESRIADLRQEREALARRMKRIDADEDGNTSAPSGTWLASRNGGWPMVVRTHLPSIAGGGVQSDAMLPRTDLKRYGISLRECVNFLPRVQGGAVRRTGTIFVAPALCQSEPGALARFAFSRREGRLLEFGDFEMRVFADRAVVTNGGSPVIVGTPYAAHQVQRIRTQQVRDVVFVVHPNIFPHELNRYSDTNWTFAPVAFKGPSGPVNADAGRKITASVLSGAVGLTAEGFVFSQNVVGGTLVLKQDNAAYVPEWEADVSISENDKRQYQGNVYANRRVEGDVATNTGVTPPTHLKGLRISGDARPSWEYLHSGTGYVKITSVSGDGSTAAGEVDGFLPEDMVHEGTTSFMLPAFTAGNGYPSTVVLYKTRIIYCGVSGLQQYGWCSRIDDFRYFAEGTLDDDAFKFRLGTGDLSDVCWLQPTRDVLTIGTENEEFMLRPLSSSDPLTPTNSDVDPSTNMGGSIVQPIQIDDATLFAPFDGLGIAERTYNYSVDAFVTDRLEWEAEHIFTAPVKKFVRQKYPMEVEWVLLENGTLISLGYQRKQEFLAFAVHDLAGGYVEDIEEIPGSTATSHEVWLLVRRTVNGETVRYIERFDDHFNWKVKAPVLEQSYLDCAKVFSAGPYTELTGLSHLEGEAVRVMADGNDLGTFTVSGGTVDLPHTVDFAICGLSYRSHIRTNMPVFPLREGDSATAQKRPTNGLIWTVASAGGEIGNLDLGIMEPIFDATAEDFDQPCPFNTGPFEVFFPNGSSIDAPIDIVCDTAMPFHLTAISPNMEVGG